jgi:hypothetical protein
LTVLAGALLAGGVALYLAGVLLWQDSAGVPGETLARCKCIALTAEGLVGSTMSVVGFLMLPLAAVLGTMAVGKWWRIRHPQYLPQNESTMP